jgi:type IV secretion system protein VirB3
MTQMIVPAFRISAIRFAGPRGWMAWLARQGLMLAALMLLLAGTAQAAGSSMPWEGPLQSILESIQGRWRASSRSSSSSPRAWRWPSAIGRLPQADPDRLRPVHRVRRVLVLPVVLQLLRRGRRMNAAHDGVQLRSRLRGAAASLADRADPAGRAAHRGDRQRHAGRRRGLGLQLWIPGVVLWIVGHALAVWGARVDPQFMQVFARHIKHRPLLDV